MPKLIEIIEKYGRKQSTGNYSNVEFEKTVIVQPNPGESDIEASFKASQFVRNHVLLQMSAIFPGLKPKLEGLMLDLDGNTPLRLFDTLPEDVQQVMIENGIDPDRFVYFMLPENVEAELKGD